jgi:hypothetical protein
MAFLEADAKPLTAGWGPPQQLHEDSIGSTLAAILNNRRLQQQQTQDALTAAIKAQQDRNQASAYGSALQSAGVVPYGVDVSGMNQAQLSALSSAIRDQTPDTDEDALHQAQAAQANAVAKAIGAGTYRGSGRGGSSANLVPLPDGQGGTVKDSNGDDVLVSPNSVLYRQATVAQNASLRTPMSPTQAKAYLSATGITGVDALNSAQHKGFQQQPDGTMAPLTPDQSYDDDATHVEITPSAGGPAVTVPKAVLENIKKALMPGSYTDDTLPNQSPPVDVAPGGGTFPPNFSGFAPGASATPPPASAGVRQKDVDQANQAPGITPTPIPGASATPPPASTASGANNVLQLRKQAQDAIASGKDPDLVKQRFHDLTGGQL